MKLIDFLPTQDNYRAVSSEDLDTKIWKRIRNWRNVELDKSDWTQLPDAKTDKDAWLIYRQWLRDLPNNNENPRTIELKPKPDAKAL